MKRRRSGQLHVYQNGGKIGVLNREATGAIYFQYDEEWLSNPTAVPVSLSLPLVETKYSGAVLTAVFDNLLPDSDQVRQQIAERTGADGRDPYSLLEAIGKDCVGALQFLHPDDDLGEAGMVNGKPITELEIATILQDLHKTPLGITARNDFRFSVAGAQEKTALLYWKNKWYRPAGTTATTHILKPQIGKLASGLDLSSSVENEHFCMTLLNHLGLPTADTEILDFQDVRALSVLRFDRWWNAKKLFRRPQEDCLQALGVPSARKYQADGGPGIPEIMQLLTGSDRPLDNRKLFLKAQICFWILAATDGHGKNFSVFLGPRGQFVMTPLYDVMSAQPLYSVRQMAKRDMKLAMSFGTSKHYQIDTITRRHLYETAETANMRHFQVDEIIDELQSTWEPAVQATLNKLGNSLAPRITVPIIDAATKRLKQMASARA